MEGHCGYRSCKEVLIPFMVVVLRGETRSGFKRCCKTQQEMKIQGQVNICNLVSLSQNCNITTQRIDVLDL